MTNSEFFQGLLFVFGYVHLTASGDVVPSTRGGDNAIYKQIAGRTAARYWNARGGMDFAGEFSRVNDRALAMMSARVGNIGENRMRDVIAELEADYYDVR